MKALLKILYLLLLIILFFLLAGIFLPKRSHVEASVYINASPDIVFDQVNTLKNWEKWSPWQNADSTMKLTYFGSPSGVGASYSWISEHSSSGKMSITESTPDKYIQTELDYGTRGKARAPWQFWEKNNGTKVTWALDNQNMGYFERYFIVLFKKNMMNTFSQGLLKLKEVSESIRLDHISDVQEVQLVQRHALIITDSALLQNSGAKMKDMFGRLMNYAQKRNLQTSGVPFTIYYKWGNEGFTTFACGIPISEKTWGSGGYSYIEMPEEKAIMVTHWGNYNSSKPYEALDNYIKNNGIQISGPPWEEYITDPKTEPDTSKWETRIYYPVK
jgi:effector-binding domain-containing protein/ribosome-associated toxin RatA of RatAB toxin-antitoxin module